MKNTEFPEEDNHNMEEWGEIWDFSGYSKNKVDDWLKRLIEDYPRPNEQTFTSCDEWFYKWFAQFMGGDRTLYHTSGERVK